MKSLQPFNLKARKMEQVRIAETGDVQALQDEHRIMGASIIHWAALSF